MLAYFPVAYSDELLYSLIARYVLHTGQSENRKGVLRDVFGTETAVAIPDLPSHLNQFRSRVDQVWQVSVTDLIKRHTLAPKYLPFLRPVQAKQVVKSMGSSQGGNIHTRCGIAAGAVQQPRFFRYCPICVKKQYEKYGEPYWQRSHQFSGIDICYRHKCKLVSSTLHFHPKEKHLYRAAFNECVEKSAEPVSLTEIEGRLLGRIQELFDLQKVDGYSAHQWSMFYQNLAIKYGFKRGARVDHRAVRQHMESDWSSSHLKPYLESVSDNDWLVNLFRKHRKAFHPLRHLMVWSSLLPDVSVSEIFSMVGRLPREAASSVEPAGAKPVKRHSSIQKQRKEWLNLLQDNNGAGIKAIRAEPPGAAIYTWLYRYDRQWLMNHRPPKSAQSVIRHTVDYEKWDSENLVALSQCLRDYMGKTRRPRLSRSFLIKQLPRSNSVEKHLKDLPETNNWLNNNAENIEDYQYFRIQKAAEALRKQNIPVMRWRLLRIAAIRFESVTSKLEEAIRKLEMQRSVE